MERYRNANAHSGVRSYEIGADFLKVRFREGSVYLYTYASTGARHIEAMKKLARAGRGLTTYINQHVRSRYAAKLR